MGFTDRQLEIIEAATKLIGISGIQNLTTKNLAAEMEFTEPALYRHFTNKSAILQAILFFYRDQMKSKMQELFRSDINALKKLTAMLAIQFDHFTKNPAIAMVVFSETSFQYEQVLSETVRQIVKGKQKLTEKIIAEGQQKGEIRKDLMAVNLATLYLGCIRFTLLKWRLDDYKFDLKKEAKTLNKMIITLMS